MAQYEAWAPGPDEAAEYTSLATLRSRIEQALANGVTEDPGCGEPPGTYRLSTFTYSANNGQPYIAAQYSTGVITAALKMRYSASLTGMLDPSSWFPGIYSPIGTLSWVTLAYWENWLTSSVTGLASAVAASGLAPGTLGAALADLQRYTHGARLNNVWGISVRGSYLATEAQQAQGVRDLTYSAIIGATDADDGTINYVNTGAYINENYSQVPQIITRTAADQNSWDEVGDGISSIPPALEGVTAAAEAVGTLTRPDTVTHASDVGQGGDPATPPAEVRTEVFGSAAALPALISTPSLISTISTPLALLTTAAAAIATVASAIWSSGLLSSLQNMANTVSGWTQPGGESCDLTTVETLLERIAEALEGIQGELVGDPEDQVSDPGLVTSLDRLLDASSRLDVRMSGRTISLESGGVWEED